MDLTTDAARDAGAPLTPCAGVLAAVLKPVRLDTSRLEFRSIRFPWQAVYGGQLVAQALVAAAEFTEGLVPASLHATFLSPAFPEEVITARLEDRQERSDGTNVVIVALEQRDDVVVECVVTTRRTARRLAPPPWTTTAAGHAGRPATTGSPVFQLDSRWRGVLDVWSAATGDDGAVAWIRPIGGCDRDPVTTSAIVAFTTDVLMADPVMRLQPEISEGPPWDLDAWVSTSLDHHIWFGAEPESPAWLKTEIVCGTIAGSRGLVTGTVVDVSGNLIAVIAQEHLVRARSKRSS